ncbi:hypothetical protein QOZ80_7BG0593920 [Eleusine coracana subsp. coracana]|nr:hypothetical protein QOZ80_7BG0593920 [Eleusine coracana subsp. coracana]
MALPSGGGGRPAAQPLLLAEEGGRRGAVGGATPAQTLGNVVVSIVGTGVLGLPYAFRAAGWLAGSLGVVAAGLATLYCMLLLVDCRDKLEEEIEEKSTDHRGWFCGIPNIHWSKSSFRIQPVYLRMHAMCLLWQFMTLALEASMAEWRKFRWVLSQAVVTIIVVYACFGVCGYLAYGETTKDIITLNLPNNWTSAVVKVGLCIALAFTFPVMMHPIHEIVEARLGSSGCFQKLSHNVHGAEWLGLHLSRILMVIVLTVVASFIPGFGSFISFVGSTMCALLSFVLPALFHLKIVGSSMSLWQHLIDYGILLFGLVFAGYGIFTAFLPH